MRNSIRTRLTFAFISLGIGPLLLVGVVLTWQSFATQRQQALNLQREVARQISAQVAAFFEGLENELHLISQVQGLSTLDRDRQSGVLSELLAYRDVLGELALLDDQGHEQIRISRYSVITDLRDRSQAAEFVALQTTGQTYYSPVRFDKITGEPLMTIAVPLFGVRTGQLGGALVAEVRIKKIWDLIANVQVSPGQSVYIVNAQGQVIAHRNPSVVLRGNSFLVPDRAGVQPGLEGSRVVLAVDKVSVGEQEFNIIAEQTISEALALGIHTVRITVALLAATLALSSTLGLLTVRQIVHPIQAMAAVAQAISAGDLHQQVKVTRQDELGSLAIAFNSMTTRLRQSLESLEQRIIEVKQAEESLRQANETLQTIFDHSPLAIVEWNTDFEVVSWNLTAERIFGYARQEALGRHGSFIVPEEARPLVDQVWQALLAQKGGVYSVNDNLTRDGRSITCEWFNAPLVGAEDQVIGLVSLVQDITERKRAESEREALIAELELQNAELERFTYTVSHDLKSPLITIGGFVGFLEKDALSGDIGRVSADIAYITDAVTKMQRLLDELLELSRIGRQMPPPENVSFTTIAHEVVELLYGQLTARGVEVVIAPGLPTVYGDRARLVEMVQNLVDNAIKFMGNQPQPRIEIGVRQSGDAPVFYVRDNGIGIEPRYHDKVFGLFDKLDPQSEGTGIGLALVKRIVETHSGHIWVESQLGQGATFCFTLLAPMVSEERMIDRG